MQVTVNIYQIDWDVDDEKLKDLPTTATIEVHVDSYGDVYEAAADALSDEYGYCVNSFNCDWFDECGEYVDEFGNDINEIEARVS